MRDRAEILSSIALTIADYRGGEMSAPSPAHVDKWARQFPTEAQLPILTELDHVLARTYISRKRFGEFLGKLATNEKLTSGEPGRFWKSAGFLSIQQGGRSQRDILTLFDNVLNKVHGFRIADCRSTSGVYIYLDDAVFSGNRVMNDLVKWVKESAPQNATVHIISVASHSNGEVYAAGRIQTAAKAVTKTIAVHWWRALILEDRKGHTDQSEVLRPVSIPEDVHVKAYVKTLADAGYPPVLRKVVKGQASHIFSSEAGRNVLEQEFLKAGAALQAKNKNLKTTHRPLGYSVLKTLGFGSVIVTFRNCPNTCPLAFWVDSGWTPLFPRTSN